jgi:hypothetical protein
MKFISTKRRTKKITSTEWHNLVVRNKAAEICENICQGIKYMLRAVLNRQWQTEDGTTKHTSEIQVTEFTFLSTKGNENNKQIDSSESTKTLTLTHKIMACLSMICHFDCLTNLLMDPEPSLSFAYTLDTDLMFGLMEYLFLLCISFWSRSSFVFFVATRH